MLNQSEIRFAKCMNDTTTKYNMRHDKVQYETLHLRLHNSLYFNYILPSMEHSMKHSSMPVTYSYKATQNHLSRESS